MELKKRDLKAFRKALISCKSLTGSKFSYALVKNYNMVETELRCLEEAKPVPSKILEDYMKERKCLMESFAKKDKKGDFITTSDDNGMSHYTFDDISKIEEALNELSKLHPEASEELNKLNNDYEKLLDEPAGIEFFKIKLENVPDNITVELMASIEVLIEE